ncbi:MAG TPA: DUF58 domain-containing protein [Mycobacteriales bacterium]|nr:DUF58 domain-containing protein [Mycobacteriales bacterium]
MPKLRWPVPRPTRTAAVLFAASCLLELLGRLVHSTAITVAAAAALGAVIGDAALTPHVERLRVVRHAPRRMTANAPATVRFVLTVGGRRRAPLPAMLLIDDHPAFGEFKVLTPVVRGRGNTVIDVRATPAHRGYWSADHTGVIEGRSPLGGFIRRCSYAVPGPTWVHPAPASPVPLPDLGPAGRDGPAPSGRSGSGPEFFGTREWRSGDSASGVHWRASARRNQLVVKDRERPADAAVLVIAGPAGAGPAWERAVARAAATATAARRAGFPVILGSARGVITPSTTHELLDWFAEIDAHAGIDELGLHDALRRCDRGSVVWLSAAATPDELTAAAHRAGGIVVPLGRNATGDAGGGS